MFTRDDFDNSIDEYKANLVQIRKVLMKENLTQIEKDVLRKKEIQTLHHKTLDILKDGGVLTEAEHAYYRKQYKNHVPLNRVLDNEDDIRKNTRTITYQTSVFLGNSHANVEE